MDSPYRKNVIDLVHSVLRLLYDLILGSPIIQSKPQNEASDPQNKTLEPLKEVTKLKVPEPLIETPQPQVTKSLRESPDERGI